MSGATRSSWRRATKEPAGPNWAQKDAPTGRRERPGRAGGGAEGQAELPSVATALHSVGGAAQLSFDDGSDVPKGGRRPDAAAFCKWSNETETGGPR